MKKLLLIACGLVMFAVVGILAVKIIGANSTSPYLWGGPLRLPERPVAQVEIKSNPIWGDPQFQRTSTNSFAAQQLISIVNRGTAHHSHFCSCIGTIEIAYANGRQIRFGYCPGHDSSEYEIVKISKWADGKLRERCYSGVSRVEFVAVMRQLGVDDSISGLALPNSTKEMDEHRRQLNSPP
ncbi:MAG: hypothetical protein HZA91_03520 [Verrucomicrobia bacterium]|nr:hypothetical protein [Verrucomicrobiota bacterium]